MVWVPLVREAFDLGSRVILAGHSLSLISSLDSQTPHYIRNPIFRLIVIDPSGSFHRPGAVTMDLVTADLFYRSAPSSHPLPGTNA